MRAFSNKVDVIQKPVIKIFEMAGFSVAVNSQAGMPDLTVALDESTTFYIEVKSGKNARLTAPQEVFRARWKGRIYIVRSVEDAERIVDEYKHTRLGQPE